MKKILFIVAVALVALTACQKGQVKETVYSVDEVFVQGDSLVGDLGRRYVFAFVQAWWS